ncbi:MAG: master DNA invertase Mpi family serine-type recombinase [Chitinispirillales bacterium]|jgi:DNA invertase Pin-like site-specific DNA recombinase|nr:master DNA invertase Mpi family serine-type recombinase [Chitinispirillales bacterium]
MIYGYIRVSTDRQTVENQRFVINEFCEKNSIKIEKWIKETISGTKEPDKRKLGKLLYNLQEGDVLICSELSRLGRNLFMIMSILNACMEKSVQVWTIKDNYRLGSDISSKVLAFAFSLSAEIERNLISQRTKEAMARIKAQGNHVGRPHGAKSSELKLTGKDEQIREMLTQRVSKTRIAETLGVDRSTLKRFLGNGESLFSAPLC